MILGKDNRKQWSEEDVALARAYEIVQGERCSQCGRPKWICQSDSRDLDYQFIVEECSATKALDKREKAREKARSRSKRGKNAGDDRPAGEATIPVPFLLNGAELASLRDPFYEEQARKYQAMLADRPNLDP